MLEQASPSEDISLFLTAYQLICPDASQIELGASRIGWKAALQMLRGTGSKIPEHLDSPLEEKSPHNTGFSHLPSAHPQQGR